MSGAATVFSDSAGPIGLLASILLDQGVCDVTLATTLSLWRGTF
jgi:hypothetical protein